MLCAITFAGCQKARELRVDDFMFGNKRTGTQTANPTFQPGEEVFFDYKLRGFYPDGEGNAKISYTITMTGYDRPLEKLEHQTFKVNSEITHFGPGKPEKISVPDKEIDHGVVKFEVSDEVKGVTMVREFPFSVKK